MQIAIFIYPGLTALDAIGPYEVLSRIPDANVVFTARQAGPITTDTGFLTLSATHEISTITAPDILLIPGSTSGYAAVMEDEPTLNWIRKIHETSTWTVSVCTGAMILGAAGLLKGIQATTHWLVLDELRKLGADPVQERYVRQGKILTAAGVSAGIDAALYLVGELLDEEHARTIQLSIEYDPAPPFDSGSLRLASRETIKAARRGMMRTAIAEKKRQRG